MRTSSSGAETPTVAKSGRAARAAASGAFLFAALALSLAESLAFPVGILPIPGAKPGLANAAVLLCAHLMDKRSAAMVSLCRVILMFFLFGNASSLIYSMSGAALSFVGIILTAGCKSLSFLGKSVIAASLHNTAQTLCAVFIIGAPAAALFPYMLLSAVLCGGITGVLLNFVYKPVRLAAKKLTANGK